MDSVELFELKRTEFIIDALRVKYLTCFVPMCLRDLSCVAEDPCGCESPWIHV